MKAKIWKALKITSAIAATIVLGWATYTVVHYLRTSPRFEVKQIAVSGGKRVLETDVLAQADLHDGINIFSVDMEDIRRRVEGLQWVRHAAVQRILPDKLTIRVVEREPVGLARIRGEIRLFDSDAAILDCDPESMPSFPILDGLRPNDREGNLRRVATYRKVVEDLQGETQLSEIHIDEAGEVSVVSASDPLLVNLGAEEFRARWILYLQYRTQIQEQYPDVVQVDFRFRNQIILKTKTDDLPEEKVVWDVEKKSL